MRQNPEKLSRFEAFSMMSLMLLFGLCDDSIPKLTRATGGAGWLAQLLCFALMWLVYELYAALLRMHGGKALPEILRTVYGKLLSRIMACGLFAVMLAAFALILRKAARVISAYAYTHSRSFGVAVLFAAVACVAALYSFRGLARVVSFCFFPAFAAVFLILALSLGQYDYKLLAPVLGYGLGPVVERGFSLFAAFIPFMAVTLFAGHFDGAGGFSRAARRGIWFAGAASVLATLCYTMAIPYHTRQTAPSGLLELGRRAYISRFLQRFEPLFLMLLCVGVLAVLAVGVFSLKALAPSRFGKISAAAGGAALLVASLLPGDGLAPLFEKYSFSFCAGFGLLTLAVSWLRKKRRPRAAVALLLALVFLAGCTSYREPDEELAALLIGYDKGERAKFKITFTLMPEAGKEAAPSGDENGGANIFSVEAESSLAATDMLGAILPKRVSLLHTRAIVISEELAREGIEEIVAPVSLYGEVRSNATVIISKCPAEEYLRAPELAIGPSLPMTLEMLLQKSHGSSAFGSVTISEFLSGMRSEYGDAITPLARLAGALPVEGAYQKELAGMALFSGDKLVGELNARETAGWLILGGLTSGGAYTVEDPAAPRSYVSFIAHSSGKPKVRARLGAGSKPHIDVTAALSLRVAIAQNQSADYTGAAERERLRLATKAQIEAELNGLIKKTQSLGCDVLQLGRHCAASFPTIQQWRAYGWPARYREAEISVTCDLHLE